MNNSELEKVYLENYETISNYFSKRLNGDNFSVEDLVQETFLRVVERADKYEEVPGVPFIKLLLVIAHSKLVDKYRRSELENKTNSSSGDLGVSPDADSVVVQNLDNQELQNTFQFLTFEEFQILEEFYFGDKSIEDIATDLSKSIGAIKMTKKRALIKIKNLCSVYSIIRTYFREKTLDT